jgi:hypothetical protein
MTIQKLNVQLEELKVLLVNREVVVNNLKELRTDKFSRVIHKYFDSVLYSEDTIGVDRSYIYFKRPQEGYSYSKELISIYLKGESWSDETVSDIETSFYSTNDNSDFELHRMLLIGKVANVLIDSKKDIIDDWNGVINEFKEQLEVAYDDQFKVKKQIKDIEDEIKAIRKDNNIKALESGYEFEVTSHNTTDARIDVSVDNEVRNITKIKLLSKTPSGKSATLEIENVYHSGVKQTNIYKNVRMNNVMNFIHHYADKRISAS